MKNLRQTNRAFTLVELVVVIAVLAVLGACLLPALAYTRPKAQRLACSNNLKQVGIAFRTWAAANGGYLPMSVADSQGGAASQVGLRNLTSQQWNGTTGSRGVSMIFLRLTNELSSASVLFCPAESESSYRQPATTFAGNVPPPPHVVPYTNDLNVSYFIGVDATETRSRMFLTGDHNLGGNGNPPMVPFLAAPSTGSAFWSLGTNFTANQGPAWLDSVHAKQGHVGIADGSVEFFNRTNLQNALKNTGDAGRPSGVFTLATGATAGAGVNRIQLP